MSLSSKAIRNVLASWLVGYGLVSFFCFIFLDMAWAKTAPHQPNSALGLIYLHNEHGDYTYFSAFQATTCWLMFNTSIPLAAIGALIAPKSNTTGIVRRHAANFKWDQDDPQRIMKSTFVASVAATPFLVFGLGPYVIKAMNGSGFVMNLG